MKKLITLLLALTFCFGLKAQTDLTQAVDFTATDCHGTEVHLFDILDRGQAVLIDFFYTTCTYCVQTVPHVVQSYYDLGCNMHDVFYMEITYRGVDTDQVCQNWCQTHGVEYPTISGPAGGSTICNQYHIDYYPTVILIMPNREIVIQDLYPIPNAQTIVNQLGAYGIQPHDCNGPSYNPQVSISIDEVTDTSIEATFMPNEDCATYYYMIATESEIQEGMSSAGLTLSEYLHTNGLSAGDTLSYTLSGLTPETRYTVYALPADPDGVLGEVVSDTATTLVHFEETLTFSMDTVNIVDNQYEINWITIYNNTSEDVIVTNICDQYEMLAFTLDGNQDFYCYDALEIRIPQGESVELGFVCNIIAKSDILTDIVTLSSNLPDASFVVMLEEPWSVNKNEASTTLHPNPANDFVTLKGESLGTVRVYNAIGQKVEEFEANGGEVNINTTGYENGVYVVKAGAQALRFVVKH